MACQWGGGTFSGGYHPPYYLHQYTPQVYLLALNVALCSLCGIPCTYLILTTIKGTKAVP